MRLRLIALLSIAFTARAQTGSISGTVTDVETGVPLTGLTISVTDSSALKGSVLTDPRGQYKVAELSAGQYLVSITGGANISSYSERTVHLGPDQDMTSANMAVERAGSISGIVTDENRKAVPNLSILLISKTYWHGKVAWAQAAVATTDEKGAYTLGMIKPGRTYAVLARPEMHEIPAISAMPRDPEKRDLILSPSYFPSTPFVDGAQTWTLRSGQTIENVDIEMARVKPLCVAGVIEVEGSPAAMSFEMIEAQPSNGGANLGSGVGEDPWHGQTGADGKFRICGLHPGEYILQAFLPDKSNIFSTLLVTPPMTVLLQDHDLTGLKLNAVPGLPLFGETVWDGDSPPAQNADVKLKIGLSDSGLSELSAPLPGKFTFDSVLPAEYSIEISGLPAGCYVKDIISGGISVLHRMLQAGGGIGALKVIVARDGGEITATVADKDGYPVQSANIWLLPSTAVSAPELETVMVEGKTDASGRYASGTLALGKYRVFATVQDFDHSPAHIDRLWGARGKGAEIEIAPNGAVDVSLEPITVF